MLVNNKFWSLGTAIAALSLASSPSYSQSTTVPGQDVGLAVGTPLPEGLYAINTFIYRRKVPITKPRTPLPPLAEAEEDDEPTAVSCTTFAKQNPHSVSVSSPCRSISSKTYHLRCVFLLQ